MTTYKFTVPGEPKAWQRAGGGKTVARFTPAKVRTKEAIVASIALANGVKPIVDPVRLNITFVMQLPKNVKKADRDRIREGAPCTKRPDLDNLEKLIMDVLNGIAWMDDSQVVEKHTCKVWGLEPRADVMIRGLIYMT